MNSLQANNITAIANLSWGYYLVYAMRITSPTIFLKAVLERKKEINKQSP